MRYLGIDYGSKQTGLAVSDKDGRIALPLGIVLNGEKKKFFREIQSLISKEKIEKIVVGLPLTLVGEESNQTRETRVFAEKLRKSINLPVDFENEILTTKIAEAGSNKKTIDASAAALILQSYLDKKSKIQNL